MLGQRYTNTFILRQNTSVPLSIRPLIFFGDQRTQGVTCHDTPCHGCQEHDTLRHAKFPDTLRSDLRLVGSVVKYHGSKNSTKLLISRSAREKHIPASQIIEGWVNHDTLSRSRLYIIYYQTSFVPFRSWICFGN